VGQEIGLKGVSRLPSDGLPAELRRQWERLTRTHQWVGGADNAIQIVNGIIKLVSATGEPVDQTNGEFVILLDGATLTKSASGLKISDDGVGADQLGILTTEGDLLTFSTEPVRLGVGADGTTLIADSGETTGLRWAEVSGLLDRETTEQDSGFLEINNTAVREITVAFGALPNNTTTNVAHGITGLVLTEMVEVRGWCSNGTTVRPLPWTDGTNAIAIEVNATNVSITTNFDASGYTSCDVFLRYTRGNSGFSSGFSSGFGA